ncbi:MAG TPA: hypothetical protein DEA61_08445 [Caldanaerobacter subterraneus]|uniref:Uncharacterized protein n=1 Tax=Caldanaerobacter subterraneus TaxID=911092 RepID=A0A357VN78_9THEO|nr:VanW family protein [Caldanaerobacter subterraneus]HBT49834.1 hypothetical protein [Caldanaerobacter subterraneus]
MDVRGEAGHRSTGLDSEAFVPCVRQDYFASILVPHSPVLADGGIHRQRVCATATAIHKAVINSGLKVVERHKHLYGAIYAPDDDAAVDWNAD